MPDPPPPRTTPADVMMRLIQDGPAYALIALVCVLALKGQASAAEALISGALALLSRSMPPSSRMPIVGASMLGLLLLGCSPALPTAADEAQIVAYESEQFACVAEAGTLAESRACRCKVQQSHGRDGGACK